MVNIKVPIGRGILSRPEFEKTPEKIAQSELQFKKELADQGKLVIIHGKVVATGNIVTHDVIAGSTFYLLGASYSGFTRGVTGDNLIRLINKGRVIDQIDWHDSQHINGKFEVPIDFLVGVGMLGDGNNFRIDVNFGATIGEMSATLCGYQESSVSPESFVIRDSSG